VRVQTQQSPPKMLDWLDAHPQWRVGWTLVQALATCVLCLVMGLPMAWVLAGLEFKGRRAWQRALMLPFVVPTLVATPSRAFWRVDWPVIAPWLASALCLVFLYCLTGFGLALVLGGQRWPWPCWR
jgi:ABC-type Fe3+ transport system permease subunit